MRTDARNRSADVSAQQGPALPLPRRRPLADRGWR